MPEMCYKRTQEDTCDALKFSFLFIQIEQLNKHEKVIIILKVQSLITQLF
jgi:hypothetical protein